VFDPNIKGAVAADVLPKYINDMITRMLAGVGPTGRPRFLKMVYHGPQAMEELVRFDPHLVVGILGGSAGTTRDAFQLLYDAQKYGARVALFGRKINNAENQLAFVHFLRLIVEGRIGTVDAVRAYHAVLTKLGLKPHRGLDEDLKLTDQAMSYAGTSRSSLVVARGTASAARATAKPASGPAAALALATDGSAPCACHSNPAAQNGEAAKCGCRRPIVTESHPGSSRHAQIPTNGAPATSNARPDFTRMSGDERLAYHRQRLGLGR